MHPAKPGSSRWATLSSVAIQAGGAIATLLVAWLVAHFMGLPVQGRFGLLKGWSDLIAMVLMVGLPQALLHLSYRETPVPELYGVVRRYSAALGAMAIGAAVVAAFQSRWDWMVVILGVPGFVCHGLLRSLVLRLYGTVVYAWATILPALMLAVGVSILSWLDRPQIEWAIAASGLCSAIAVWLWGGFHRSPPVKRTTFATTGLWRMNASIFVQNVCVAAQAPATLGLILALGANASAVGEASFAMYFQQAFALFAGFIAPPIYDRYARHRDALHALSGDQSVLKRAALISVLGTVAGLYLTSILISLLFPAAYLSTIPAAICMGAAGMLSLWTRFFATVLLAAGEFTHLSWQASLRLATSLGLCLLLFSSTALSAAESAGVAAIAGELVVLALVARRLRIRRPIRELGSTSDGGVP
jgi:hypothetical protein